MSYFVLQNGICTIVHEFVTITPIITERYDVICGGWLCEEKIYYQDLFKALMDATNHKCTHELTVNMIMSLCFCNACGESYGVDF